MKATIFRATSRYLYPLFKAGRDAAMGPVLVVLHPPALPVAVAVVEVVVVLGAAETYDLWSKSGAGSKS